MPVDPHDPPPILPTLPPKVRVLAADVSRWWSLLEESERQGVVDVLGLLPIREGDALWPIPRLDFDRLPVALQRSLATFFVVHHRRGWNL